MRLALLVTLLLASCSAKRTPHEDRQRPFDFRLVNPNGFDPAYMDWTHEGLTEIKGRVPGQFDFLWFHPPCTTDCEDIPEGECGCLECEPADPVMREFEPFGEILVHWEGPHVYTLEEDSCGCTCARAAELPLPHEIIVGMVSYYTYECLTTDCAPDASSLIADSIPHGDRRCATHFMDIPHDDEQWTILMGTVCDSDWP